MQPANAIVTAKDEVAERNRFESFKLGKGLPSGMANRHAHARSHSRNGSMSSSISSVPSVASFMSTSKSTGSIDTSSGSTPQPPSKRNSHHRRRSSIASRVESAEMMGVTLPDLPSSSSDDNVNLGEKDSIRRRALWALEGKPDVSFSKVEIPELSTPVMEKIMFDFVTKPSLAQSSVSNYAPPLMSNKRDSFKLLAASSSSKDQLHTLMEEEEEEEEEKEESAVPEGDAVCHPPITPDPTPEAKITSSRPRPANLHLRPLSLTPENLVTTNAGLPTPSPTPSPRWGLKALALTSSPIAEELTNVMTQRNALSLNISENTAPTPVPEDERGKRRSSISYKSSSRSSTSCANAVVTNFAGLPTPEMTPTSFDRRYSFSESLRRISTSTNNSSGDDEVFPNHPAQTRPLSASEQHFLFKSHNALLARIQDLERALSKRMSSGGYSNSGSSRPVSLVSDSSTSFDYESSGQPSDEMLILVADLKAERDELKRDVDGWRTRVADMEKQLSVVAGRVDSERRDAWLARSMTGLLEVEKKTLENKLEQSDRMVRTLEDEKYLLLEENGEIKERVTSLEVELEKVKQELAEARAANDAFATPVPQVVKSFTTKRTLGFRSVDSASSTTDVDDTIEDSLFKTRFPLIAVSEDDEDDIVSDEENGLDGYEDENDSDIAFHQSSSSFDSVDSAPRSVTHLRIDVPSSVTPEPSSHTATPRSTSPVVPQPTHSPRTSISRAWTFPIGAHASVATAQKDNEVDRFFDCLQDDDVNDGNSPLDFSFEKSKGLFASGFKYETEVPFFLPFGDAEEPPKALDIVMEEDEEDLETPVDDEDMFGEIAGIQITFTPPQDENDTSDFERSASPVKALAPVVDLPKADVEDEPTTPFRFAVPPKETSPLVPSFTMTPPTPPRPTTARTFSPSSPSSIPRPTFKPVFFPPETSTSTPPRSPMNQVASAPVNAFMTPPSKRGGAMPSFIPQPVSSPSPIRSVYGSGKSQSGPMSSRQPRKPLGSAQHTLNGQGDDSSDTHVNCVMNTHSSTRYPEYQVPASVSKASSEMSGINPSEIDTTFAQAYPDSHYNRLSRPPYAKAATGSTSSTFTSIMSAPLSGRLSLQTFTNFIPLSWTQRSEAFEASGVDENTRSLATPNKFTGGPNIRVFVSKEKQLEKLRIRLERESPMKMKTSVHVCCKNCEDGTITL